VGIWSLVCVRSKPYLREQNSETGRMSDRFFVNNFVYNPDQEGEKLQLSE
jgi:hypothetical protein